MTIAKPRLTEDQFMRLPDDGRKYELVDGEAKPVPASVRHDIIGVTVAAVLRPAAKGIAYISGPQAGFRMRSGNIRCPDVAVVLKSKLPNGVPPDGFGDAAPDICIEIISPSEEPAEKQRKLNEYFDSGATFVWHLTPETKSVRIYMSPIDFTTLESGQEIDGGSVLPTFHCTVADLFELE